MSKHTPGPWKVREIELGGDPYFEIVAAADNLAGERIIAQTIVGDARYPDPAEHANARLIAAAPELLSFVRDCHQIGDRRASALLDLLQISRDAHPQEEHHA